MLGISDGNEHENAMAKEMFLEMANKKNEQLDEELANDESDERYPVMKTREPLELIQP